MVHTLRVNERAGRTINAIRERAPHAELRAFMHSVPMDRERVRNLAHSSSYVKHGVADIPAFLHALDALLDATSPQEPVDMRYATRAIAAPLRDRSRNRWSHPA
ncbi:MAG: hypothetical protein IPN38_15560 [Flavobacteriales bacterium]|nr:hypothetical protein [Flavobacteriales bacterium]